MRGGPILFGVLAALLLAVAFWFLLYKPASEQQAAVEAETAQLEQQARTLQQQIDQLEEIKSREVEINAALARLENYIPTGPQQPAVIRHFQRTADASGAAIASVAFADPAVPTAAEGTAPADTGAPGTLLANIQVTMELEGGYFQVVDFFRRLEVDVPRAVLVQTVDVQAAEAGFPTLRAAWTGQIFAIMPAAAVVDTSGGTGVTGAPAPGAAPSPSPSPSPAGGE